MLKIIQLGGFFGALLNKLQDPLMKSTITHDNKYCYHYALSNFLIIYRVEFRDWKQIYWGRFRSTWKSTQEKGIILMILNEIKDTLKIVKSVADAHVLIKCKN